MNRLSLNLARIFHVSIRGQIRTLVYQIFGHESLYDIQDCVRNSHCKILNIDIYRVGYIKLSNLAWRKLLNPLKYIELVVILPFVFTSIALVRGADKIEKFSQIAANFLSISGIFCNTIGIFITGLLQCILAPARKIIRPAIELALTKPRRFAIAAAIGIISAALIITLIATGSMPAVILSVTLLSKIALVVATSLTTWLTTVKVMIKAVEAVDVHEHIQNAPSAKQQSVTLFTRGSTDKITAMLHEINPELTAVSWPEEQLFCQSLALFTGTEALFYPPQKRLPLCETETIPYLAQINTR